MLCSNVLAFSDYTYREQKTYYIEDIWAEEMFIEPTKEFIAEDFARYGYRHTPYKDEADIRVHITIHSVKNKPEGHKPFVIWPITGKQRDVGEARITARVIENETNREVWANSIKGRSLENILFGWLERPKDARMKAYHKALGLVFDPFFVHDMPLFD
jgi:hypothetical protein